MTTAAAPIRLDLSALQEGSASLVVLPVCEAPEGGSVLFTAPLLAAPEAVAREMAAALAMMEQELQLLLQQQGQQWQGQQARTGPAGGAEQHGAWGSAAVSPAAATAATPAAGSIGGVAAASLRLRLIPQAQAFTLSLCPLVADLVSTLQVRGGARLLLRCWCGLWPPHVPLAVPYLPFLCPRWLSLSWRVQGAVIQHGPTGAPTALSGMLHVRPHALCARAALGKGD